MIPWLVLGAVAVIVLVAFISSRRRPSDGVASFQRQIDALSHEARRSVVDQVQRATDGDDADDANGTDTAPRRDGDDTDHANRDER